MPSLCWNDAENVECVECVDDKHKEPMIARRIIYIDGQSATKEKRLIIAKTQSDEQNRM